MEDISCQGNAWSHVLSNVLKRHINLVYLALVYATNKHAAKQFAVSPATTSAPPLSWQSQMSHFLAEECDRLWLFKTQNFVNSLFFWLRKVEIDLIRPRRSCLTFCGKRFCGRFQTQKVCWLREGVEVVVGHSMGQFLFWQCVCLLYKGNIQI